MPDESDLIDNSLAANPRSIIYPGGVRVTPEEHASLQFVDKHAQSGAVSEETLAELPLAAFEHADIPHPVEGWHPDNPNYAEPETADDEGQLSLGDE